MKFRKLREDEIELRVAMIKEDGCSLLLYKDARVDMKILDEEIGPMNWKRHHEVINNNLFCTVSIYNKELGEWVSKQDVGIESYSQKEKGQASDAFKRACFNWGIGRELYTAPFIWIELEKDEVYKKGNGWALKASTKFYVNKIEYDDKGTITDIEIYDQNDKCRKKIVNGKSINIKSNNNRTLKNKTKNMKVENNDKEENNILFEAKRQHLSELAKVKGKVDVMPEIIKSRYKKNSSSELTINEIDELLDYLKQM